jgi:hypothetical protein
MAKDQKTSSIATKSSKEWITLRPTLWGMSIDLKEAWYRLREWWQSPDKKEYPDSGERADNPEPEVGREINASVERIPNEGNAVRQADRIRQFAFDQYIAPARAESRGEVTVRAGDVHREMGLIPFPYQDDLTM